MDRAAVHLLLQPQSSQALLSSMGLASAGPDVSGDKPARLEGSSRLGAAAGKAGGDDSLSLAVLMPGSREIGDLMLGEAAVMLVSQWSRPFRCPSMAA